MAQGIFELGIPLADLNADFKVTVSSLVGNFRRVLVVTFDLMAVFMRFPGQYANNLCHRWKLQPCFGTSACLPRQARVVHVMKLWTDPLQTILCGGITTAGANTRKPPNCFNLLRQVEVLDRAGVREQSERATWRVELNSNYFNLHLICQPLAYNVGFSTAFFLLGFPRFGSQRPRFQKLSTSARTRLYPLKS